MKLTYYGHSCIMAEHGGVRVIIDPFLSGNPAVDVVPGDIRADAVILTHGHDDHFGDALEIARNNDCPVIAVHELALHCAFKGVGSHGMNLGGAFSFEGFSVKLVPALHSNSVRDGETLLYAGVSAGVLLTMGGLTFYHLGDTALFSDLELVGRLHRIDAAAVPIGGNYTMGPDEGVLAAQWIKPGLAIPVHYNTFSAIMQDGEAFARNCEENGIPCRVLDIGESLEL